jgi:hypothetical protein
MAAIPNKAPPRAARAPKKGVAGGSLEMAAEGSGKRSGKVAVFQFGSAKLKAPTSHEDWARNIGLGQAAMKKIKTQLVKPGLRSRPSKSTPMFRADPANPRQLIRILDGQEDRGVFVNGVFQVRS